MIEIDAILLTGESAFGLPAADGVMKWLEEHDTGYQTPWAKVPLVPAAVLFDLNVGRSDIRPDADASYLACENALGAEVANGNVGARTGATVGKWQGLAYWLKRGIGSASTTEDILPRQSVGTVKYDPGNRCHECRVQQD